MQVAVDSSTHSEEPWDQKGLVETAASAIRKAEDEELGELPSLAMRISPRPVVTSSVIQEEETEEEEEMPKDRKAFWRDMEDAADALARDHGPDDEMAARKAARRRRRLEAESQLTDEEEEEEEEEEEVYETTFCGSTFLGELCGGTGTALRSEPAVRVRSFSPRSASSDQQQEQTAIEVEFVDRPTTIERAPSDSETSASRRMSSDRARRAKETMKSRRAFRKAQTSSPQDSQTSEVSTPEKTPERAPTTIRESSIEEQQQKEQLEVELEEPEKVPLPSPATQKKNARLAAIAKKARDNFQVRKGKPANVPSEPVQAKSTTRQRSSPKKSVDEDYASFTATEKRIFIKLINSGMPATEATQRVIRDRVMEMKRKPATSPTRRPFWKKDPPLERTADPPGESSIDEPASEKPVVENTALHESQSQDEESSEDESVNETTQDENEEQRESPDRKIVSPLMSKLSAASPRNIESKQSSDLKATSSDDLFPFEKTGLNYFDATRREKDEDPSYRDAARTPSSGRLTPRFFSGKSPGFSELKESPERRSNSAPPSRSPESASQNRSINVSHSQDDSHEVKEETDESFGTTAMPGLMSRMAKRYQKFTENEKPVAAGTEPLSPVQARSAVPLRAPSGDEGEEDEQVPTSPNDSLDMDTYLDSAKEGFVPVNVTSDTASVFTTGTNVTGTTSYTTSTRTRRPGAAKSRLAKHKQHGTEATKQLGWRQSIQAAAQTNNRKWDPEKGWVDYEEPEVYTETAPVRQEKKIKVDLTKAKPKNGKSPTEASKPDTKSEAVSIPFPDEWANERKAMIQAKANTDSVQAKSRGWEESMKIASAQQAKDGSSWNKDQGWINGSGDKTSDSVDFSGRSRPLQLDTQTLQPVRGIAQSANDDLFANEEVDQQSSIDDDNVALLERQPKGTKSPMVQVIKQRVSENDMSHFSPTLTPSNAPVDVDEVTKSMEEQMNGDQANKDSELKTSIGSKDVKVGSERPVKRSGRNKSAPGNIPKLNRSLRDTSPIAFRKKDNRDSSPEDEILIDTTKQTPRTQRSTGQEADSQGRHSSGTASIKERMKTWETRIGAASSADADENLSGPKQILTPGGSYNAAGWKTFLGKKVREGRDSVEGRKTQEKTPRGNSDANALNISDISPIDAQRSEDEAEYGSSAYGPSEAELKSSSLMKRISECASPVMASTYKSRSIVPPALCGRRSADDEDSSAAESSEENQKQSSKSRSSAPKQNVSAAYSVATSSVVSEDFGLKTAYLDAVAMKTAVSRSRRPTSRRRARSSASSVASSTVTDHSEKWSQLLEKRRSNGKISSRLSSSDISRATEKYASDKVSEIMQNISSRSKTVARSREVHREHEKSPQRLHKNRRRAHQEADAGTSSDEDLSIQAAEDLAAARVEAMMAALSADQGNEGEI